MEEAAIKSMLNTLRNKKSERDLMAVASDGTILKIDRKINALLKIFLSQYQEQTGNTKIGKASYIKLLLDKFFYQQRALVQYDGSIDPKVIAGKDMLPLLQAFKKIMHDYVDRSIRHQSDAVLAIVMYSSVRAFEEQNNLPTTDYRDREFEDEEDRLKFPQFQPTAPLPNITVSKDLSDLFEDDEVLKPPKLVTVPAFPARGDK